MCVVEGRLQRVVHAARCCFWSSTQAAAAFATLAAARHNTPSTRTHSTRSGYIRAVSLARSERRAGCVDPKKGAPDCRKVVRTLRPSMMMQQTVAGRRC